MRTKELKKYPFQIILMAVTFVINMLLPLLFSYLIDDILISRDFGMLLQWLVMAFAVAVISMVMKFFFTNYNPVKIGIKNSFTLQKSALRNIMNMNQTIYSKKDKGYYYNLCENSTGAYGDLHEELHLNMYANLIYIAGMLAFITYINWAFGVFFVIYGIVLVIISLNSSRPLYHMNRDIMAVQDVYLMDMRNIIENKSNINALHTEEFFHNKFACSTTSYEKYILRYQFFNYLCNSLPEIVSQICNVAFLFVAAGLVMKGEITAGILVMGYQYMGYFATPIATVCSIAMRYRSNKVHIERVDELEEDAAVARENTDFKKENDLLLKAEDFDFYKGEEKEDFLYHIDKLELKKNGLYVIKGENGSGKSMLLNLMLGNVSAKNSKGYLSVSKDMDAAAMLTYPFFAINGSFADNLYGIEEKKELGELLRVDFVEKEITANPVNLSYGQQQKLALMRVFGTDAPILFLDEPLSNLDVETQQEVVHYIAELKGKKSILAVMHSDELDEIADGVVEIRDGRILERDLP
ncbi:MAG: ABC transporter ATP-binding protein/permease [Ruminococcus sp.]|nr:ABC transporter ATP-binding protein/permease [Ruminococcus sp.]